MRSIPAGVYSRDAGLRVPPTQVGAAGRGGCQCDASTADMVTHSEQGHHVDEILRSIGGLAEASTSEMHAADDHKLGFGVRLAIVQRSASKLAEPAEATKRLTADFVSRLHDVDQGLRLLISRAPSEIGESAETRQIVCTFLGTVRTMSGSADEALKNVQKFVDTFEPLERLSRSLRPSLRRLREGLTLMVESGEVTREWVHLVDALGLDCGEQSARVLPTV